MMVSSVNGKITRGDDPEVTHWTSPEDSALFKAFKKNFRLIVRGSKTYEASRKQLTLTKGTLNVVLTRNPDTYHDDAIPGRLEFTSESPKELISRLEKKGYKEMLLTGGSDINALFLQAGLINEIHLTIEPKIFGTGKNLFGELALEATLQLTDIKQMNDRGTLHLVYTVAPNL
jgi:dihydrofolate reductase